MSVSYNVTCVLVGRQYRTLLYAARVTAPVRVAGSHFLCMGPTNGRRVMLW